MLAHVAAPREVPWLPYSRIGTSNNLDLLLRSHNIRIDEVFYWWQLQGGDVHSALLSLNAFQPVPPVFSLPLCCLRLQQAREGGDSERSPSLTRVEFLAAFADCWVHNAPERYSRGDAKQGRCSCLTRGAAGGCILPPNEVRSGGDGRTRGEQAERQKQEVKGEGQNTSASIGTRDGAASSFAGAEAKDSFFLTGFTGDRNWRDVRLWNEGDVRVFGKSVKPRAADLCCRIRASSPDIFPVSLPVASAVPAFKH